MPAMGPFYAYKETRLNLDPATQGSTVTISLPAHGASTWSSRKPQKRPHDAEISIAEDEGAFRKKYLATAASMYHRQYHTTPRSFLWRILEDEKVLAIRAVDVCRQTNVADATLTLRLSFPSTITSGCVAFADSKDHDILNVFVVTESRQLYSLGLRPDYFRKSSSTVDNVRDWCKVSIPSSFTIGHPHRLVALSADELLVSSPNGELQKLVRRPADGKLPVNVNMRPGAHFLQGLYGTLLTIMIEVSVKISEAGYRCRAVIPFAMRRVTSIYPPRRQ
jgi:nuclear pore complex protein Nup160